MLCVFVFVKKKQGSESFLLSIISVSLTLFFFLCKLCLKCFSRLLNPLFISKSLFQLKKQIVQSPLNNTPGASPISIKEKGAEGVQMANVTQSPGQMTTINYL